MADRDIKIKFCGLTESADIAAAVLARAAYVGFVFYPRSARNVAIDAAAFMAASVPAGIRRVALTVDAGDALLDELTSEVPLDMLQLHGAEPPGRVAAVRARYGLPVMKAVGISDASDLARIDAYSDVADQILVDAKPAPNAALPGGNGVAFDWRLLRDREWRTPWMLAGGLHAGNIAEAVRLTGARQVDVSSGIEARPGLKDGAKMREFAVAASGAFD